MERGWAVRLAALLAVVWALLLLAGVASAEDPPYLSGSVANSAGISLSQDQIDGALKRLESERNFQLFVVYVRTTQPRDMESFTQEVVRQNNLGPADALLVVATQDRTYQMWLGDRVAEAVSQNEQDDILADRVEPALRSGDYTAAAVRAADGIRSASGSGGGGGGGLGLLLPIIVILALGGLAAWWFFGRRKAAGAAPGSRATAEQANALLIETDEALRDARQELDFARAEFGEAAVASFGASLEQAATLLKTAFERRQAVEDSKSSQQRADLYQEIVQLCSQAKAQVEAQQTGLQELRDMERNAPAVLQTLKDRLEPLQARLGEAEAQTSDMQRFAESNRQSVSHNADEASQALDEARQLVLKAESALAAGDSASAVGSLRTGQERVAQAQALLEGIANLHGRLRDAEARLQGEIAAAASDVETARGLPDMSSSELRSKLGEAESALGEARRAAAQQPPDVLRALEMATTANSLADQLVAQHRELSEQRRRSRDIAESSLRSAEASYSRAADYVRARRGQSGVAARTTLSEAERHIDEARRLLAADEPQRAAEEALAASRAADQALSYAQSGDYGMPGGAPSLPGGGFGGGLGGLGGLGGIILGGLGGLPRGSSRGRPSPRAGGAGRSSSGGFGSGGRSRGGRW